jgi:diguanylate cyclase (GGDEF)-like protein
MFKNQSDTSLVIAVLVHIADSSQQRSQRASAFDLPERHAFNTVLATAAVGAAMSQVVLVVPASTGHLALYRDEQGGVTALHLDSDGSPMLFPETPVCFSSRDALDRQTLTERNIEAPGEFFLATTPVHGADGGVCGMLCVTDTGPARDRGQGDESGSLLELLRLCALQAGQICASLRCLSEERAGHARALEQAALQRGQIARMEAELQAQRREIAALAQLSDTDSLTGIKNRRAFDATIREELEAAGRNGTPVSMLMIDIDHFKQYNDTYGHVAGDAILKTIAMVMQCSLRSFEHVARYGGEEFAIILPNSTAEEARHAAERLQRAVERHPWPDRAITISVGVSTTGPRQEATPAALIESADSALYNAKANGRNRVETWECFA